MLHKRVKISVRAGFPDAPLQNNCYNTILQYFKLCPDFQLLHSHTAVAKHLKLNQP